MKKSIFMRSGAILLAVVLVLSAAGCSQEVSPTERAVVPTTSPAVPTTSPANPTIPSTQAPTAAPTRPAATTAPTQPAPTAAPTQPAPTEDPWGEVDPHGLTETQRNSINMLNYLRVLTQEINDSQGSRLFLETAYSLLVNNIYPNAVDAKTQEQLTFVLDALESYRMLSVKRERLEFANNQNEALSLRQILPDAAGLVGRTVSIVKTAVDSPEERSLKDTLKTAAAEMLTVIADGVDVYKNIVASLESGDSELRYLNASLELGDEEATELHNRRKAIFNYMISMVRDNNLPGDYTLNEEAVQHFVEWKNNTNLTRRLAWLESNMGTYKQFGLYWLELARAYYESGDYVLCLKAFGRYEAVTSRIFRRDHDYAEALPMAILAARETMSSAEYVIAANSYCTAILNNAPTTDWALRYFVAQIYIDLFAHTRTEEYLTTALQLVLENVNVLVNEQQVLNRTYLEAIKQQDPKDGASNREKEEVKQYNNYLKEARKTELPPISEALYLNCDLLFALAKSIGISVAEQRRIDSILHENGERLFLTKALDDRFWFSKNVETIDASTIAASFNGTELQISGGCVTNRSQIIMSIKRGATSTVVTDLLLKQVDRKNASDCGDFVVTYSSEVLKKYSFEAGDVISIQVLPVAELSDTNLEFVFEAVLVKVMLIIDMIEFHRK